MREYPAHRPTGALKLRQNPGKLTSEPLSDPRGSQPPAPANDPLGSAAAQGSFRPNACSSSATCCTSSSRVGPTDALGGDSPLNPS